MVQQLSASESETGCLMRYAGIASHQLIPMASLCHRLNRVTRCSTSTSLPQYSGQGSSSVAKKSFLDQMSISCLPLPSKILSFLCEIRRKNRYLGLLHVGQDSLSQRRLQVFEKGGRVNRIVRISGGSRVSLLFQSLLGEHLFLNRWWQGSQKFGIDFHRSS